MRRTLAFSSTLAVPAGEFWRAQSLATVNAELRPLARMTARKELLHEPLTRWTPELRGLTSWVLLLGLLPVDRHRFDSVEFPAPTAFVEHSSSWLNRVWRHERVASAAGAGCTVRDAVSFEPRLAWLGAVQEAMYRLAFRCRHANLRRQYRAARA